MSVLDKFKLTDRIALVTGGNRGARQADGPGTCRGWRVGRSYQ